MDPGPLPHCLSQLTDTEEQLIGRIKPIMSINILKVGGQLSYSGSVINFMQETNEIAKKLPRDPRTAMTIVVAKATNKDRFKVLSVRLRAALLWLKANNRYYADIEIDEVVLSEIESINGEIGSLLPQIDLDIETEPDNLIHESAVYSRLNKRQNQLIQDNINGIVQVEQPTLSTVPINEYTTAGYIAMAFPKLFPTGSADLRDLSNRRVKVNPAEYFEHLMKYNDQRFAHHPRFRFFAMNSSQRWMAASQGKVLINRAHIGDLTVG